MGDWDDGSIDMVGVYNNDVAYLRNVNASGFADLTFNYGIAGDIPIAGDWNGLP